MTEPRHDQPTMVVLRERDRSSDVWVVGEGESLSISGWHWCVVAVLVFLGAIVGPLGTFSLPKGLGVSSLWPAMAIQAVGGIWFGGWGMLAAAIFPIFSNWVIGGSVANVIGFIPANLVQGGLAAWYFRRYRIDPRLRRARDYAAFVIVACVLANLCGALLGTAALALGGEIESGSRWTALIFSWTTGNGICCLVLGIPLLRVLSPVVVKSDLFCKTMWRSNAAAVSAPRRFADMPILLKLLGGFLLAGIVPLLLVAGMTIRQIRDAARREIGNENVALAYSVACDVGGFLRSRAALLAEVGALNGGVQDRAARRERLRDFERRNPQFSAVRFASAPYSPLRPRFRVEELIRLNETTRVDCQSGPVGVHPVVVSKVGRDVWILGSLSLRTIGPRLADRMRQAGASYCVLKEDGTLLLRGGANSEDIPNRMLRSATRLQSGTWGVEEDHLVAVIVPDNSAFRVAVVSPFREKFAGRLNKDKNLLALLVTVGIFSALIVGGFIARHIGHPIDMLIRAARRIGAGELDTRIELSAKDEIGELAQTLNQMSADLRHHIDELRRTTSEKERIEHELEIAADLQRSLLPTSAPDLQGVEVAGLSLPARQAGGDFFDHFLSSPSDLIIALGDASGKGLPAALFAARVHGAARAAASYAPDAVALVSNLNRLLAAEVGMQGFFVTFFFGQLDLERSTLQCANAGHDPALVLRSGAEPVEFIESSAPPLGAWEDSEYELQELHFGAGDLLVLYSDGVTDAMSPGGELFGRERLVEVAAANRGTSATEMLQNIYQATQDFAQGTPQQDDLTILVLRFK